MRMLLLIAYRNLLQAKRRSLFLSSALGIVTMLLVLLMALSQGIEDNVIRAATTLSTGHVNVAGFYKATANDSTPIITQAPALKQAVEELVGDELDHVILRHRGWARLVSEEHALQALLVGVDMAQEPGLGEVLQLADDAPQAGERKSVMRGDFSALSKPKSAVIFESQARTLMVKVGDNLTLRTRSFNGATNTVDVTVVAIAKDIGLLSSFSIFVPKQVVLDLYQLKPDTSGAVQLYLKDMSQTKEVMAKLRVGLDERGYELMEYQAAPFFAKFETVQGEDWVGQKVDLTTWEDEVTFLKWILTSIDTVSFSLVAILVVIIAVGVMNTMWISVRKRIGEIGTVRAMGMQRSSVLWMILFEAILLGAFASSIGALTGALIAQVITLLKLPVPVEAMRAILLSDTLVLSLTVWQVLGSILSLTLFTTIAGLWPALKAARMQPVEAIQRTQ